MKEDAAAAAVLRLARDKRPLRTLARADHDLIAKYMLEVAVLLLRDRGESPTTHVHYEALVSTKTYYSSQFRHLRRKPLKYTKSRIQVKSNVNESGSIPPP